MALERILGRNDLTPVSFLLEGARATRTVGRIRVRDSSGKLVGWGTGFLVSPRLLLTNNHVLESVDAARFSLLEMNYEEGALGRLLPVETFRFEPDRLFITSKALDFTLLAIAASSLAGVALEQYGFNKLFDESGKALKGEAVNIIQHPNGQATQVALRENQVSDVLDDFVHYVTDTAPGSSGAPVFNDQWEVVALHHSGVPSRDDQGRVLAVGGVLWRPGLEPLWAVNEGIRISRIMSHVRSRNLSGLAADLVEQMLESSPPSAAAASLAASRVGGALSGGMDSPPVISLSGREGTTEVTIPVRLRLSFPELTLSAPSEPRPRVPSSEPGASTPLLDVEYYDAAADEAAREEYYAGINPAAPPEALFTALSSLVIDSHRNKTAYNEARLTHLYPRVDVHPDGLLRSIYSGKSFTVDEILRQEFALEARLQEKMQELLSREQLLGRGVVERELALFEAALPYNCEHVVPQSWFNRREPMRADLHHLFTCESGVTVSAAISRTSIFRTSKKRCETPAASERAKVSSRCTVKAPWRGQRSIFCCAIRARSNIRPPHSTQRASKRSLRGRKSSRRILTNGIAMRSSRRCRVIAIRSSTSRS